MTHAAIETAHRTNCIALTVLALLAGCKTEPSATTAPTEHASAAPSASAAPHASTTNVRRDPLVVAVPGCTAQLVLLDVPGEHALRLSSTEVAWDMYDAFVFALDRAESEKDPPDAFTRPTKPYILMDRGFGHAGYPAISVSFRGASEFCKWLSSKTGKRFRLPTEAEWENACRAGSTTRYSFGDDASALADFAWFRDDSATDRGPSTHPVGEKKPNAWGFHDVHGNAAEWTIGAEGRGVAKGGSYQDAADQLVVTASRADSPAWNRTDPQVPKSKWWLADAPFMGFRVACDD